METAADGSRKSLGPRSSRLTKRTKRNSGDGKKTAKLAISLEPKPLQRVFLYMQLKNILNLPVVSYPLELHIYHAKDTLVKMSEHYTTETVIYENEFNLQKPAFAMGIIQDSIEDMNTFSDNPLVLALFQRIPRHRAGDLKMVNRVRTDASAWGIAHKDVDERHHPKVKVVDDDNDVENVVEEAEVSGDAEDDDEFIEERLEFLSRGHCDLLQLFQRKRFISNIPIMLYPEYERNLQTTTSQKITTTSEWHMYSILPVLKNLHFTNLAFITLESLYHVPEELHVRAGYLGMSISIRSTRPDFNQEYLTIPLCTFYGFGSQIINEQSTVIVWESMKRDLLRKTPLGVSNNQMETSSRVKLPRLFRQLLKTPNADLKLHQIDPVVDAALINNSVHRYVLTPEMREILEAAIVHNEYELLLQLYDEITTNVLYEGTINPSIFGYPEVHHCRFACVLTPVARPTRRSIRLTEMNVPDAPMFAILMMCFFQPLTKRNDPLDTYNENQLKTAKLRRCTDMDILNEVDDSRDILREFYRAFDEFIKDLISYIVKHHVTSVDEKPNYFCCNISNLINLLVNICGCDFNMRMPTKTNIEFRQMLTHMHKELMERIEGLLCDCSWQRLGNCVINLDSDEQRTRRLLEEYRNMCIAGECVLARQLFVELKSGCTNVILFNFYEFLIAVESLNFTSATNYLLKKRESNWQGEYFVALLKLYVDFKVHQKQEETPGEAYSQMIEQLRIFAIKNNLDREIWILLHCYYTKHNYLPGMEYTRWKYENLYEIPRKLIPVTPRPLFDSILPIQFEPVGRTLHAKKYFEVFRTFTQLGAYGFAEVIFDEISDEFTNAEVYLIKTTLTMLQGEIDKNFKTRRLPTDNSARGKLMSYLQSHINGNVEYSRRRYDEAIKNYRELLTIHITNRELLSVFYTSLLRLGVLSFERGNYELSVRAYELCVPTSKSQKNFIANYGMGLTLYHLNQIEESIEYLSRSTDTDVFMPDPWGYLAVINLRMGHNKTALNCWKVAKMYPELPLSNHIYAELEKIKYSDICLLAEDDSNVA